jgi:hypothetical protein
MNLPPATFWTWFRGFAKRLPDGELPAVMLDELLNNPARSIFSMLLSAICLITLL